MKKAKIIFVFIVIVAAAAAYFYLTKVKKGTPQTPGGALEGEEQEDSVDQFQFPINTGPLRISAGVNSPVISKLLSKPSSVSNTSQDVVINGRKYAQVDIDPSTGRPWGMGEDMTYDHLWQPMNTGIAGGPSRYINSATGQISSTDPRNGGNVTLVGSNAVPILLSDQAVPSNQLSELAQRISVGEQIPLEQAKVYASEMINSGEYHHDYPATFVSVGTPSPVKTKLSASDPNMAIVNVGYSAPANQSSLAHKVAGVLMSQPKPIISTVQAASKATPKPITSHDLVNKKLDTRAIMYEV